MSRKPHIKNLFFHFCMGICVGGLWNQSELWNILNNLIYCIMNYHNCSAKREWGGDEKKNSRSTISNRFTKNSARGNFLIVKIQNFKAEIIVPNIGSIIVRFFFSLSVYLVKNSIKGFRAFSRHMSYTLENVIMGSYWIVQCWG